MRELSQRSNLGDEPENHMIDLLEFLASVLGEDLAPSTRRGLVVIFAVTFLVLLSATGWALMTSTRPLRTGTFVLVASTVLVGGTGVVVALIHRARSSSGRDGDSSR
jgi:hypothetical protein